jgi:hypothetical protein
MTEAYRPMNAHQIEAVDAICMSIAEKRGVEPAVVRAELDVKAAAKKKKNERESALWLDANPQYRE